MAKSELGTKRLCIHCGAKFYDLAKTPIVCPKCDTVLQLTASTSRQRPDAAARTAAMAKQEVAAPEPQDAEFVSLEEADAEASGKKVAEGEEAEGGEDEIEIDPALDDSSLIEEEEESDDDVADIIGDVENEEEA